MPTDMNDYFKKKKPNSDDNSTTHLRKVSEGGSGKNRHFQQWIFIGLAILVGMVL